MPAKRIKRPGDSVFVNSNLHGFAEKHRKIADTQNKIEIEHIEKPNLSTLELAKTPDWEYDGKCLDLAFAMDCTSSMAPYINTARDNIRHIVEDIVASENSDVRLALVEYRDHPPQDSTFVTRVHDFTESSRTMKGWLSVCEARGGGDIPEAVSDALQDILNLDWRGHATKICVCVSDAPPHGLGTFVWNGYGTFVLGPDGFPDGCPQGIDPMEVTHNLAKKGISLYVVGCEPAVLPFRDFFMALAFITGGQYVPLTRASLLTGVIIGGAREEISLHDVMVEVNEDVRTEIAAGRAIDKEGISKKIHSKLTSQGVQTNQLRRNKSELDTAETSSVAKKLIRMKTLAEVREHYKSSPPVYSRSIFRDGSGASFGGGGAGFSGGGAGLFALSSRTGAAGFGGAGQLALSSRTGAAEFGGAGPTFGGPPAGPSVDAYDCVVGNISYAQTSRMVQKSIARNISK